MVYHRPSKHPYGSKASPHVGKTTFHSLSAKILNAEKYCEFHEQNGLMTADCRALRKALHELADKGHID